MGIQYDHQFPSVARVPLICICCVWMLYVYAIDPIVTTLRAARGGGVVREMPHVKSRGFLGGRWWRRIFQIGSRGEKKLHPIKGGRNHGENIAGAR